MRTPGRASPTALGVNSTGAHRVVPSPAVLSSSLWSPSRRTYVVTALAACPAVHVATARTRNVSPSRLVRRCSPTGPCPSGIPCPRTRARPAMASGSSTATSSQQAAAPAPRPRAPEYRPGLLHRHQCPDNAAGRAAGRTLPPSAGSRIGRRSDSRGPAGRRPRRPKEDASELPSLMSGGACLTPASGPFAGQRRLGFFGLSRAVRSGDRRVGRALNVIPAAPAHRVAAAPSAEPRIPPRSPPRGMPVQEMKRAVAFTRPSRSSGVTAC